MEEDILQLEPESSVMELNMDASLDDVELEAAGLNEHPVYTGQTTIVPELDMMQILPTENKVMLEDIAVMPIPITETSNIYGGKTVIIG